MSIELEILILFLISFGFWYYHTLEKRQLLKKIEREVSKIAEWLKEQNDD